MSATVHYGHFDNSGTKKYAITDGDTIRKHEDAYGHMQVTTWSTKAGATKAAQ